MNSQPRPIPRRKFLKQSLGSALTACSIASFSIAGCARRQPLSLDFLTIPDPDGWHPSLRLKGDWLVFRISDGMHAGYGEASHSKQDEACKEKATMLFGQRLRGFQPDLENLRNLEAELAATSPDFVTATAWSGINQALYDLIAKREGVPVWQLFQNQPGLEKVPLYTTINRALTRRDAANYLEIVDHVAAAGFESFKCAPFEKVAGPKNALQNSREGMEVLTLLRERFPDLGIRVDFHERFLPGDFFKLLPELEALKLNWLEEPFEMGRDYATLRRETHLRIAAGELFWGKERFREIMEKQWAHVIMPDVKHVGGFGPLLEVIKMAAGKIEVSPHNPSGPVSTAASLHAAALHPDGITSIEYAFDRAGSRHQYGEIVENGFVYLSDRPGWGINAEVGLV